MFVFFWWYVDVEYVVEVSVVSFVCKGFDVYVVDWIEVGEEYDWYVGFRVFGCD